MTRSALLDPLFSDPDVAAIFSDERFIAEMLRSSRERYWRDTPRTSAASRGRFGINASSRSRTSSQSRRDSATARWCWLNVLVKTCDPSGLATKKK